MLLRLLRLSEFSRRLNHHLRAHGFPVDRGRIFLRKNLDCLAINSDGIARSLNRLLQIAQDRVILQQMGQRCWAGEVVHGHKFQARIVESGTQHVASDPAKAVDANFDCHVELILLENETCSGAKTGLMQKVRQERACTKLKLVRLAEDVGGVQTAAARHEQPEIYQNSLFAEKGSAPTIKPRVASPAALLCNFAWLVAKGFLVASCSDGPQPFRIWAAAWERQFRRIAQSFSRRGASCQTMARTMASLLPSANAPATCFLFALIKAARPPCFCSYCFSCFGSVSCCVPFISCLPACSSERCFGSFNIQAWAGTFEPSSPTCKKERQKDFCASCFCKTSVPSAGTGPAWSCF